MTNKNICKFSTPLISSSFWISRFILEANTEVMKWRTTLNENRVYLISKGEGSFTIISKELPFTLFLIRMFQRRRCLGIQTDSFDCPSFLLSRLFYGSLS